MERKKLIVVTDINVIDDLRAKGDVILAYPLKSFCVGYPLEFSIDQIDEFVLINRILPDNDIQKLNEILSSANIKGIIFDDLGVIEVVKDLNIEKILMLNHLGNNSRSINYYLDYVDSIITSTDITKKELKFIMAKAKKPLVLNTFGLVPLMYSRRNLLSNFAVHNDLAYKNILDATINEDYFKVYENPYGTVFYTQKYYYLDNFEDYDNVLYYYFNPVFLNKEEILAVVNLDMSHINTFSFLLDHETYFKLKGGNNND